MMVFRKVQEGMGGRVRLMLVGSAPLAENVLTFIRCALGCLVSVQIYFLSCFFTSWQVESVFFAVLL